MTIQYTQLSAGSDVNNLVEFNYSPYWYAEAAKRAGSGAGIWYASYYNHCDPFNVDFEACYCVARGGPQYNRMNPYVPTRMQECDGTWVIPVNYAASLSPINVEIVGTYTSVNRTNTHQGLTNLEVDAFGNIVASKFNSRYFPCKEITDHCGCAISHFIGTTPLSSYVLKDGSAIYNGKVGFCCCSTCNPTFSGVYFNCDYRAINSVSTCWNHLCHEAVTTIASPCKCATRTWALWDSGPGAVGNIIHRNMIMHCVESSAVGSYLQNQIYCCGPCLWYQSGTIRYGDGHSMQYSVNGTWLPTCYEISGVSFVFNEHSPENIVSEVFVCAACNGGFDKTICTRNIHSAWAFVRCNAGASFIDTRKVNTYGLDPWIVETAATVDPYDCNNFYVGWVDTVSRCTGLAGFCCNFHYSVVCVASLCAGCAGFQEYCRDYGNNGQIIKYAAPDFSSTFEPTFLKSWQYRREDLGASQADQAMFSLNDIETRNCHLYIKPVIQAITQISLCCAVTTMPNVLFCECNCDIKYVTHFSVQAGGASVPFDWIYTCRCTWVTLTASAPSSWSCKIGCFATMSQQNACYAGGFCSLYLTEWNSDFTTSYGTVEIAKGTHMGMTCGWCTQGVYYGTCVYGCTNKGMIEVFRVNYNHFDDTILVQMQATNSCNTTSRSPDLMKLPSDISCVCDYYTQLYSCGKTYMTYGPICHCFNCACVNRTFSALSPDCSATCPIIYTSMHVTGISDHLSNGFMTLTRMIPQDTATVLTQSVICSTYCFCDKPEICYAFDGLCAFGQGGIVFNQYVTCMRCICIGNSCCNPAFNCQGVEQRKILPQGYMFSTWRPYNEGQMSKPTGGHQRTNLDFKYT